MAIERTKTLLAAGLLTLWTAQAAAFLPSEDNAVFEIPLPETEYIQSPQSPGGIPAAVEASELLASRHGGSWEVTLWNPTSNTPQIIFGSGPQLARGLSADAQAEQAAMSFIASNPEVLRAKAEDLVLERVGRGAGKVGVHFSQRFHGIPVHGGRVKTLWDEASGKLQLFGSSFYRGIDVSPVPAIGADQAQGIAQADLPFNPATDKVVKAPELVVLPVPQRGGGATYHLVWRVTVGTTEPVGEWVTHVDAHDGRIIWRYNGVNFLYSGTSQGDVFQTGYCDGQETSPFRNMSVTVSGLGVSVTDSTGGYSVAGTGGNRTASCQFNGTEVNVNDTQHGDSNFSGTIQENVPLTINWNDATISWPEERSAFYWVNATHAFVKRIDPTWDLGLHQANVNLNSTCNAFYNLGGMTMGFYREGGGCPNSAHLGDVIAHEYGHGIQYSLGLPTQTQGMHEGNADIIATYMTDSPRIGPGWSLGNCAGELRNCLNTLIYPDDVIGSPIHNAGRVICGFNWDARVIIEERQGQNLGKGYSAQLWHYARKVYLPDTQPEQVAATFVVDDDDANLANGTPNYFAICTGADNHGFTCPAGVEAVNIVHTPLTDTVSPGPYLVTASASATGPYPFDPTSPTLHWSVNGGAYSSIQMTHLGGPNYEAQIPGQGQGTAVAYYLTAENTDGVVGTHPDGAPANYHLFAVGTFNAVLDDDIETDQGWTISEVGADGNWERADPNGTTLPVPPIPVNPENDHTPDPGVICWVTGNPPPGSPYTVEEVDGRVSLVSRILDMQGVNLARGTVWLWAYINQPTQDHLDFSISSDGGNTWTLLERIAAASLNQWIEHTFELNPFDYNLTSQMRFRFTAEDAGADHPLDCAMDDFFVQVLTPGTTAVEGPVEVQPLSFVLYPGQPNPFNPRTEIRYQLPRPSAVKLTVFDVAGRELRVLVDEVKAAGLHAAMWDGTDGEGQALASGVYFYRLKAGDFQETRRMTLLK